MAKQPDEGGLISMGDLAQQKQNIPPDVRANYVVYLRLCMAIQQVETVLAIPGTVQHPKSHDILKALKVWANRAWKNAEPASGNVFGVN